MHIVKKYFRDHSISEVSDDDAYTSSFPKQREKQTEKLKDLSFSIKSTS